MAQLVTVKEQQRGQYLRLVYSVTTTVEAPGPLISKQLCIDDLVNVYFSFEQVVSNSCYIHKVSTSFQQRELAKGSEVKLKITSEMGKFSKDWICQEWDTEWIHMLDVKTTGNKINSTTHYNSLIDIVIFVSEFKTISFANLYDDTDLVDFYLKTRNSCVGVHKTCLAAHSDVFKAMLTGEWKEKNEGFIEFQGTTEKTLQHLKDYLYLGNLPEDQCLKPLLGLAAMYMIDDLKTVCIAKLAQTVSSRNLLSLVEFSHQYKIPQLCFAIMQVVSDSIVDQAYKLKKEHERLSRSLGKVQENSSKINETVTELDADTNEQ